MGLKKRKYSIMLMISLGLLSCSTHYIGPEFYKFRQATELVGKNTLYAFEELMNEEMELLRIQAEKKSRVKPQDFEPSILRVSQIELRREFIRYLNSYTELLLAILENDNSEQIRNHVMMTEASLTSINKHHDNFLTDREKGLITAITGAITEAVNDTKKMKVVLSLMNNHQFILDRVISRLKHELENTRIMVNNIFNRQFIESVERPWPEKMSQRAKYSKIALKLINRKNKLNVILGDLIKAIQAVPKTHQELYKNLKNHQHFYERLAEFVNFAYRIQQNYEKYSNSGDD